MGAPSLVSLWEIMEKFHAGIFLQSIRGVATMLRQLATGKDLPQLFVHTHLITTGNECVRLKLPVAANELAQAKFIYDGVWGPNRRHELSIYAENFLKAVEIELRAQKFLRLRQEHAHYYDEAAPFGDVVADRFPKAIDDIEGAAKCVAVGQGTAAAMHLMRVMESGLKALATSLGIPYAPSWESYLSQIQRKIAEKTALKSNSWKKIEPFMRDASGDLLSVKQAWRNPTMHIVRKYSPDEAEEIYRAVRTFMQRLANGLPRTKGRRKSVAGRP